MKVTNVGNVALPSGQKINIEIDAFDGTTTTVLKTLTAQSVTALGANLSATFTATGVTLPLGLAAGTYNIVAVADSSSLLTGDTNRGNNTATSPSTMTVTQGTVNLSGIFGTLWTLPATTTTAKALTGYTSIKLTNTGTVPLPSGQSVNIAVFAHNTTTNADTPLVTLTSQLISALAANGTATFNPYVNKAAGYLPAGTYQIEATVTPVNNLTDFAASYTVLVNALGHTLGITVS